LLNSSCVNKLVNSIIMKSTPKLLV